MNLDIPLTVPRRTYPLWHRPEPIVAVVDLDSDYRSLQAEFPLSWHTLIHAKGTLDALNSLCYHAHELPDYRQRIRPLADVLARDLENIAQTEKTMGRDSLARQVRLLTEAVVSYAQSGTWPTVELSAPTAEQPWLFCGPLKAWSPRNDIEQLALFTTRRDPAMQAAIDAFDEQLADVYPLVSSVCGIDIDTSRSFPDMFATQLLLAGGVSAIGHKQFAHFFPEDSPLGHQAGTPFTMLFSNVHRERLRRCSLACLQDLSSSYATGFSLDEIVQASVTWFRGHDLGHFWDAHLVAARNATVLTPFEWSTLEETLADILGVIVAAHTIRSPTLAIAFSAEILRYLTRDHWTFPDSAAAVLEVSWLHERACLPWEGGKESLDMLVQAFRDLVPLVRAALLKQDQEAIAQLRGVLHRGRTIAEQLSTQLFFVPSDLEYSFG